MIQEIKEYDSDTCSKIGIRIQDIRESRHMKAIELASYLGIGKNQMSRIESGKANCTIPQLYCIVLHKSWIALLIFCCLEKNT